MHRGGSVPEADGTIGDGPASTSGRVVDVRARGSKSDGTRFGWGPSHGRPTGWASIRAVAPIGLRWKATGRPRCRPQGEGLFDRKTRRMLLVFPLGNKIFY